MCSPKIQNMKYDFGKWTGEHMDQTINSICNFYEETSDFMFGLSDHLKYNKSNDVKTVNQ